MAKRVRRVAREWRGWFSVINDTEHLGLATWGRTKKESQLKASRFDWFRGNSKVIEARILEILPKSKKPSTKGRKRCK